MARNEGEPEAAIAQAERVLEAEYAAPFLAHAALEPPSCTAVIKDGQVDVWTSTQDPESTHAAAAEAAGVAPERVYVHRAQAGGSFGRLLAQDHTRLGVGIAKAAWLPLVRSTAELQAMSAVKRALDPRALLNPGVLDPTC